MVEYQAAMYLRLSKEDGDKAESMSISNQKDLIRAYVDKKPEIQLSSEWVDDGYSGANFDRPSFQNMMEEVKKGRINCIIVKDLSRFARNFVESERYLEQIFPFLEVRFIAINDNIDSLDKTSTSQYLIRPIKNLINDAYLADLSIKIRSQLEIKRKKGEFIAAHTPYGYRKSLENPKKLEIDETVVPIIRDIFRKKIAGYSAQSIANLLNHHEILSPMEYKIATGQEISQNFKKNQVALWSANAIFRILRNPVYAGTLVQGKFTTINYKSKEKIKNPVEKQCIIPDSHPKIIEEEIFQLVQQIYKKDARTSPTKKQQYPLSGLVFCGDCKNNLIRRNNNSAKNPKYILQCATYKEKLGCSRHFMPVVFLEEIVLNAINLCLLQDEKMEEIINLMTEEEDFQEKMLEIMKLKGRKEAELNDNLQKQEKTLKKFQENQIDPKDFHIFTAKLKQKQEAIISSKIRLEQELDDLKNREIEEKNWKNKLKEEKQLKILTRSLVVALIDRINYYENKVLEIHFRFHL